MNVLLLGSGGREHALAWAIAASPLLSKLYCAPGNAGIAELATCVPLDITDHAALAEFCRANRVDLVVVGPEAPLVAGVANDLAAAGFKVFGPTREAARLEGSKGFTKDLCRELGIPTAAYGRFSDAASAKDFARSQKLPVVVKADGLAAGKGVVIAETHAAAEEAIDACFGGSFGAAGAEVVIEEFLEGEEASFFALVDGKTALPLGAAQDHKRAFDADKGPNTGGMGAYSPVPVVDDALLAEVMDRFVDPTLAALRRRGIDYRGVLYAGLMLTPDGPRMLEYNVRFGDPECQVVVPRMTSDLAVLLAQAASGAIASTPTFTEDHMVTVVCASEGYPSSPRTGDRIEGIDEAASLPGVTVFCAGVGGADGGGLVTAGGRVLDVCGTGPTLAEARSRAYEAVSRISWPGMQHRGDIAEAAAS